MVIKTLTHTHTLQWADSLSTLPEGVQLPPAPARRWQDQWRCQLALARRETTTQWDGVLQTHLSKRCDVFTPHHLFHVYVSIEQRGDRWARGRLQTNTGSHIRSKLFSLKWDFCQGVSCLLSLLRVVFFSASVLHLRMRRRLTVKLNRLHHII